MPAAADPLVLDGVALRDLMVKQIAARMAAARHPNVCLATVLVGDDAPSRTYVRNKHKFAAAAGLKSRNEVLPATASQTQVEDLVGRLAADPAVHGILVQQPLPAHLDNDAVLHLLPAEKDVDGLTTGSLGRLVRGEPGLVPCTPLGVLRLLEHYKIPTAGRHAVIVGRSALVGTPLALLLSRKGVDATATIAHSRTSNLAELCRSADIIVGASGQARMIGAEHCKPGATLIDVGISRTESGIVGDVDFDAVKGIAGAVTPMPGGTGPMTIACLLENTVTAATLQCVDL
ncbi:MAG: bifunctional 5,10-methylenetetrahydrofolate dehydrogenase/5,10-methenyltetrahydrofolate cyclohydrolase [Acidobacteria bacterium]|nr:bifunctional 5,10-methylenetetrahydrofolate dehydrogenase/5,10-methenyltetrahydrofolate cyclohydrolase [Acidobacteriota bacterium]